MPTYQYACTGCDERLEVVQRFSDDPLTECAVCGGRLRKIFSPVGIVFKGSGFYRTDSRGSSNGVSKAKEPQPSGSASGSSKAESTKPASGDSGSSSASDAKTTKKTDAGSSATAAKVA